MNLVARAITTREGQRLGDCQDTLIAHTLRAEGHDASEDGTGRGTPLVPVAYQCHGSNVGPMGTLRQGNGNESGGVPFVADTITANWHRSNGAKAGNNAGMINPIINHLGVRRLTPRECERLQGFPDDWTRYTDDGQEMSNSARYRMLGNAVCVNVAEWIGRRIVEVEGTA